MVDVSLWNTTSHLVPRLHEAIPPIARVSSPSVRTSATQTRAEWWLLNAEWQASHMLCCELFSLLNFHIFKGSLKAISVTIVIAPAVSHQQSLVSQRAYFLTDYSEPGDKVFPTWSQRSATGRSLLPFNWCPWEPVTLSTQILTDPSAPVTICPLISNLFKHSHRPTKQLQLSPQCHLLAFTAEKLNDSERCFKSFIWLVLMSLSCLFSFFSTRFVSSFLCVLLGVACATFCFWCTRCAQCCL